MDFRASSFSGDEASRKCDEYRQHAAECRDLAYEVRNEGARKELLDLADIWLSLAYTRDAAAH